MPESPLPTPGSDGAKPLLRALPSVDRVLAHPALDPLRSTLPAHLVTQAVRDTMDAARIAIANGSQHSATLDELAASAVERATLAISPSLRAVINATGVILHTNLGRAPLSTWARLALVEAASYSNLEYDLQEGTRGSRFAHAVDILRRLTGCEDALVVNNNAAALVLVLTCLARGNDVLLSRGQSVEIGGGFRIPEIMQTSGARLVEVGTTNRTYLYDYARAVTPDTSLILRVHTSNFRIVGFTTQPDAHDLAGLAHEDGILMVDDIGSGALLDTTAYGLHAEPTVQDSIRAGADLTLFSGDKLLGGPQCGIILGQASAITALKEHPLARALRVDKLTLAALEATLLHYLKGEAEREIPVWRMISMSQHAIERRAQAWKSHLDQLGLACEVVRGMSAVGGGSLPGETLPTFLLAIQLGEQQAGELAATLRQQPTPVIARIEAGALLFDPRTVLDEEEETLLATILRVVGRRS